MAQTNTFKFISKKEHFISRPSADLPWISRVAEEHWGQGFLHKRVPAGNAFIAYIQNGEGIFETENHIFKMGPGTVLYIAPDKNSILKTDNPRGIQLLIIIPNQHPALDIVDSIMGPENRLLSLNDPGSIEKFFYTLVSIAQKDFPEASNITGELLRALCELIMAEHSHAKNRQSVEFIRYSHCREYISQHYQELASVSEAASASDVSQAWMCRLFNKFEKMTPHQFLLKQKMNYALHEIQHGRSLSKIAEELGFSDQYSFSKTFKRVMGFNPSEAKLSIL